MIALVQFQINEDNCLMPRVEALRLNISFEEVTRLVLTHDNKLYDLKSSYHKVQGETCFQSKLEEEDTNWYDTEGKKIDFYYVNKPAPESLLTKDYVKYKQEQLVDLFAFAPLCGLPYVIKRSVQPSNDIGNLQHMLHTVEKKLERLQEMTTSFETQFNTKCDVHVGGGLIATFNEVKLLEDSCTDILQTELANGWRVIACCVQPDQRRPDYVLGRYNTNLVDNLSAKR